MMFSVVLLAALVTSSSEAMTLSMENKFAAALLDRVNEERAANGLPALCSNKKLQVAARRHVEDQSPSDYVSDVGVDDSSPEERVAAAGYQWQSLEEVVDSGNANPDSVVDWWMRSTEHDAVLGDYTMAGSAYSYNKNTYSKHHWVLVFATGSSESCDS